MMLLQQVVVVVGDHLSVSCEGLRRRSPQIIKRLHNARALLLLPLLLLLLLARPRQRLRALSWSVSPLAPLPLLPASPLSLCHRP